jgi:UDP-N-acetylglucosamine--N-acetylmuramyl-(pentapeptide) pyrophosphoryl-undecaprenol N-acetylglucosamine transferase
LNFVDTFVTLAGVFVAIAQLFKLYPDVVMSKGGYTSVPIVVAAWLLRIPIVIHESDVTPGRANKLASHFARYIAISYADTASYFPKDKTALTGIPIRKTFFSQPSQDPNKIFGIETERRTVLVLGGSQGAERINELMLDTLDELLPTFNVIHQTGKDTFESIQETARSLITDKALLSRYHPVAFMDAVQLHEALTLATIVVSRAGSGTIHEIAISAKPAILIPIPEDVSHDQRTNAYTYARTGAATVLEEKNMKDGLLEAEIKRIIGDRRMYEEMSKAARAFAPINASDIIATALIGIGSEHE